MNEGHILIAISVVTGFIAVLGFLRRVITTLRHMERKLDFWAIEHEMLVSWYCKQNNIEIKSLPTRSGGLRP